MKNNSNNEDIGFIKQLQNNNMRSIKYSEIKDPKLVKLGSYGIALKGFWRERPIIMKHISKEMTNKDSETIQKLIHKLYQINHPNILKFLGTSIDLETKSFFGVLGYVSNGNLHDYLSKNKNLEWIRKIQISKDIACGLEYLHDKVDIIHRDLNIKTILITDEKAQISNPLFLELNFDTSSISLQEEMIGFTDPELLKDRTQEVYTKLTQLEINLREITLNAELSVNFGQNMSTNMDTATTAQYNNEVSRNILKDR
ncbi:133_t:CDS:2 [Cetraspora pellucida]|uniref:133_t:CDS:1 n=1 Tax=Cetraspora pellucida TaxID=1433469 RepID=A0ACA9L3Y8_9GLOM|nr:133_t:CDS:2 [Cetraspora pellucida]